MFPKNITYNPADFTGRILIETLKISSNTKAFLKEKAITTLLSFLNFAKDAIEETSNRQIRREIEDFYAYTMQWLERHPKNIRFSRNIPPPRKKPSGDEKVTLIALLLAEPLFGRRKNIAQAKNLHLPRLYQEEETEPQKRSFGRSFIQRHRLSIAS